MTRVVPGFHSVVEVLKVRPRAIRELWVKDGAKLHEIISRARDAGIPIKTVSPNTLDQEVQSHQGVLAFVTEGPPWPNILKFAVDERAVFVVMDSIEDPHNLGSVMRSAWNFGAKGVMGPKSRAVGFSPAAQKVACGAFEHVPFSEVSNIAAELRTLKENGFWTYGLKRGASPLHRVKFPSKVVFVVGAEGTGIRKPVADQCDEFLEIPQTPQSNSFNASVALAIGFYEYVRQNA